MNIGYLIVELVKIEGKYSSLYNDNRIHLYSYRMLTDISDKLFLTRNILGHLIKYRNTENLSMWVDAYIGNGNKALFPAECEFIENELLTLVMKSKISSRNIKLNKI